MGCSESVHVNGTDKQPGPKPTEKPTVTKDKNTTITVIEGDSPPNKDKDKNKVTVQEWFNGTLTFFGECNEDYVQPVFPDHYVQEEISFNNDNLPEEVLNKPITVKKKSKTTLKPRIVESWSSQKPLNKKYVEPADAMCLEIEIDQSSKRKSLVAIGGLYISSRAELEEAEKVFDQIDHTSVHSVVILGNLFDAFGCYPLHELPPDITEVENRLSQKEAVLTSIRKLSELVTVYILKSSHDLDLSRATFQRLLGEKVIYVQQTKLVICSKLGNQIFRVCFTSGQDWDILNNTTLPRNQLLLERTMGYYLGRAASSNPDFTISKWLAGMIEQIPTELLADFLSYISKRPFQNRLTEVLLSSALRTNKPDQLSNYKCVVGQSHYILVQTILDYPYIKFLLEKVGNDKLMDMLYCMAGEYGRIAKTIDEDVLISGLGDVAKVSKLKGLSGQELITACAGSCSRRSEKATVIKVTYPKPGYNGSVEIAEIKTQTEAKATEDIIKEKTEQQGNKPENMDVENLE